MANYTYFVITPGSEINSYIQFPQPDLVQGNYFKFGDTTQNTKLGVRQGYTTHNPDFGIGALITDSTTGTGLGTKIKKDIINDDYPVVLGTEWFSVTNTKAWALFNRMLKKYDDKTVDDKNYPTFKQDVLDALNKN